MSCEGKMGTYTQRRVNRVRICTFNQSCLQIWRPNDLSLALHGLPTLAAGDDSLYGVIDAGGGGDGVGEVVRGGDVYMLGEVVAVIGSHVSEEGASVGSAGAAVRGGMGRSGRAGKDGGRRGLAAPTPASPSRSGSATTAVLPPDAVE